jgi:hypothetical protein
MCAHGHGRLLLLAGGGREQEQQNILKFIAI